jgi:hypothetical protein
MLGVFAFSFVAIRGNCGDWAPSSAESLQHRCQAVALTLAAGYIERERAGHFRPDTLVRDD